MGSDSRPVCHRCAQIKQACDGSLPCARCVRLSLPCRPRNSNGAAIGLDILNGGDMPKARIRRVQTGCLMCKHRKKKCDEIKPRCGDCRRLCLDCAWPPDRHLRSKPSSAAAAAANAMVNAADKAFMPASLDLAILDMPIRSSPSPLATPPGPRQHGIHDKNSNCCRGGATTGYPGRQSPAEPIPLSRPVQQLPSLPVPVPVPVPMPLPVSMPPGPPPALAAAAAVTKTTNATALPPTTSTTRKTTTTTTAAAAVVSPAVTTLTMGTETASLEAVTPEDVPWELSATPSHVWAEAITPVSNASPSTSFGSASPTPSLSVYVPQLLPQLSAPQDRALLNHYATIVSAVLSRRSNPSNPYNRYLLPMAQGSELVLHCVLALSANHWRKLQPSMGDRGLLHKSKATQSLARLLPHVDRTSADIALVSSLLLCMTELFDGTSEGWKLHLKGAKRLLTMLRRQRGEGMTGHYKFLLRLARFLDSAATTSTCRPPLMGEEELEAVALDRMTAPADEDDSAVYGIPKELFHLVDRINTLADLRSTRIDRPSELSFREHAKEIEERIDHWSYEYGGLSRAIWNLSPGSDDLLHATVAFEHAIRLRLHQIVEGYELTDPKVGHFIDAILDSVQRIRYGSPLEPCLLFPLVMAGGACWKLEHRVVIQDRLMIMERTCGFGYIYNARDLVERVWLRRDQTKGTDAIVNWARIRYYEMNGLVVF